MVVDWREKAQQHWIEQLEYCVQTFGEPAASGLIKSTDAKIERICKFPESGTRVPLLNDNEMIYRYVLVQTPTLFFCVFRTGITRSQRGVGWGKTKENNSKSLKYEKVYEGYSCHNADYGDVVRLRM